MFSLPSPLHPAVVHFPIVLVMLGAAAAVAALVTRRWHLAALTAILLTLGAAGAAVAFHTGEQEGELVAETAGIERLLDEHETWAGRARALALAAAVLAIGAAAIARPALARWAGGAAAAVALSAAWCVVETGHRGGQLVYRHGAGVMPTAAADQAAGGFAGAPVPASATGDD